MGDLHLDLAISENTDKMFFFFLLKENTICWELYS